LDDDEDLIKKIPLARSCGVEIGGLTWKTYSKWKGNGWYDLFANRMRKSSRVTCSVVRNSCSPLSDAEPTAAESESDDEGSSHFGSKAGSPNCQFKESPKRSKTSEVLRLNAGWQEVSEPGAKCFKGDSLPNFEELKLQLEQNASEETQRKVGIVRQIEVMDGLSREMKGRVYEIISQIL